MIDIQRANQRGGGNHEWLQTRYSFSFSDYYNPERMGFGALRVINEDVIAPGQGFGTHGHDNMEIVTIVLKGALEHKDSTGNHGVILPGDVQRMSAGTGIRHSEFNHSQKDPVHLLQIWVIPKERGISPGYEQKSFSKKANQGISLVSGKKNKDSLFMHQDAVFSMGFFDAGKAWHYEKTFPKNGLYAFVIEGKAALPNKEVLSGSDAASLTETSEMSFSFPEKTQLLLIEVPL